MRLRQTAAAMLLALAACGSAWAAGRLAAEEPARDGDALDLSVGVVADEATPVSGVDFVAEFDPRILELRSVEPGAAAREAEKSATFNLVEPGRAVVVVIGMNQTAVVAGELVQMNWRIRALPPEGSTTIRLGETTFTNPAAEEIPSEGVDVEAELPLPGPRLQGPRDAASGAGAAAEESEAAGADLREPSSASEGDASGREGVGAQEDLSMLLQAALEEARVRADEPPATPLPDGQGAVPDDAPPWAQTEPDAAEMQRGSAWEPKAEEEWAAPVEGLEAGARPTEGLGADAVQPGALEGRATPKQEETSARNAVDERRQWGLLLMAGGLLALLAAGAGLYWLRS